MYVRRFDGGTNTLYIYFYGELVAEEMDKAIFEWVLTASHVDALRVQRIFADLRHIVTADLRNTDVARVSFFFRKLSKKLLLSVDELESLVSKMQIVRLIDGDSHAGKLFRERLGRMSSRMVSYTVYDNVEAAVQKLGLQVPEVEKIMDSLASEAEGP